MNPASPGSSPTTGQVALGGSPIRISRHAIDHYSERVDRTADRSVAGLAIADMLAAGKHVVAQDRRLAHCDVPALNLQLRRNINSSRAYARPIDLAAGWAESPSRTPIGPCMALHQLPLLA